jgi:hypothetical protein
MRWIPVTERLPEGNDAISCEAWCAAEEPGEVAGPCIMRFDAEAEEGDQWSSSEDTGCWEPGPVTHWRPRPESPLQADLLMGVIGADGQKHCLFSSRTEEDAAVARSPLKVAEDLMALGARVGAFIGAPTAGVAAAPAGYALVPLDPPESLRGQLCGYGADLGHMDPRDRAVIVQRGAERWAEILRWAGAAGVSAALQPTFPGQTLMVPICSRGSIVNRLANGNLVRTGLGQLICPRTGGVCAGWTNCFNEGCSAPPAPEPKSGP